MTKIHDDPKIARPTVAKKSTKAAKPKRKAGVGAKGSAKTNARQTQLAKSGLEKFPRSAWKDTPKLDARIADSKQKQGVGEHPRLQHTKPSYDPSRPDKAPPIAMRYGLRPIDPDGGSTRPPIAMRYGLRPPIEPPPIAMRYGLRPPNPGGGGGGGGGGAPPIAMRYGLRPPIDGGGGGGGGRPPIAMRYGLRPPTVQTQARQGVN